MARRDTCNGVTSCGRPCRRIHPGHPQHRCGYWSNYRSVACQSCAIAAPYGANQREWNNNRYHNDPNFRILFRQRCKAYQAARSSPEAKAECFDILLDTWRERWALDEAGVLRA